MPVQRQRPSGPTMANGSLWRQAGATPHRWLPRPRHLLPNQTGDLDPLGQVALGVDLGHVGAGVPEGDLSRF